MLKELFTVGLGGALGAMARYLLGKLAQRILGNEFPWGTLAANMSGCFLIGLIAGLLQGPESATSRLFLVVGILGGYTTFSAFGLETLNLLKDNSLDLAVANIGLQLAVGLLAVVCGQALSRAL